MGRMRAGWGVVVLGLGVVSYGQGTDQGNYERGSLDSIQRAIDTYLGGEFATAMLTAGEYCEWKVSLQEGDVLIAEARSPSFDPALQVLDSLGQTAAENDDRFPGGQAPLVLMRCAASGEFRLRVKSFKDKSGGECMMRYSAFKTVELGPDNRSSETVPGKDRFLLRIPMKAGQVKEIASEAGGPNGYSGIAGATMIGPTGLPDPGLARSYQVTPNTLLLAPVDGDYYLMARASEDRQGTVRIHAWTREIPISKLHASVSQSSPESPTNRATMWELPVKAGQLLELSVPELGIGANLTAAEAPDVTGYSLAKPESNPFLPQPRDHAPDPGPVFDSLSKRFRDGRIQVIHVRRDAKLWIASNASGNDGQQFELRIRQAARDFVEGNPNTSRLRIGDTDYWAFDAQAGDVMTLENASREISPLIIVRDPDLAELRHYEPALDQTADSWRMVAQKQGRYLIAVACVGNGGSGEYSLARKTIHPNQLALQSPASGQLSEGQIQVWRFTVDPEVPLILRWTSSNWSYGVAVYDDRGNRTDFQRQVIDAHTWLGILSSRQRQTYVVVLTGGHDKADFSIDLSRAADLIKKS